MHIVFIIAVMGACIIEGLDLLRGCLVGVHSLASYAHDLPTVW